MGLAELFVIAVGLSMDACAVSICKGLSCGKLKLRHCLTCGIYFGIFQGMMPFFGWLLGVRFQSAIVSIDHWIAFVLLAIIGGNMIKESREEECDVLDVDFSFRAMLPLAVATSIDALAMGVTFAFLSVPILPAITFIGVITFAMSAVGTWLGSVFGARFKSKAEFAGGVILILMGTKILLEHLGIIN